MWHISAGHIVESLPGVDPVTKPPTSLTDSCQPTDSHVYLPHCLSSGDWAEAAPGREQLMQQACEVLKHLTAALHSQQQELGARCMLNSERASDAVAVAAPVDLSQLDALCQLLAEAEQLRSTSTDGAVQPTHGNGFTTNDVPEHDDAWVLV